MRRPRGPLIDAFRQVQEMCASYGEFVALVEDAWKILMPLAERDEITCDAWFKRAEAALARADRIAKGGTP